VYVHDGFGNMYGEGDWVGIIVIGMVGRDIVSVRVRRGGINWGWKGQVGSRAAVLLVVGDFGEFLYFFGGY